MPVERQPAARERFAWGVLGAILILSALIVAGAYLFWYLPTHPSARLPLFTHLP